MPRFSFALAAAGALLLTGVNADAQCQLANPSFELSGSPFAGWVDFGNVSLNTTLTAHGRDAASVNPAGASAGVFQDIDAGSGQRFDGAVSVAHPNSNPLTNGAFAQVKVEWISSGNTIINTEFFPVIDASTPVDTFARFTFQTGPAPGGTSSARIVLAVETPGPTDSGEAVFDFVDFQRTGLLESVQLNDFPGNRIISFGGIEWRVKGPGFYGPGPNNFADDNSAVFIDINGDLHMTLRNVGGTWFSTEIMSRDPLGYGDYLVTTKNNLNPLDRNAVLGLFTWEYPVCFDPANPWNLHNEFDIEVARWGAPANGDAQVQFVAQPFDFGGNLFSFRIDYVDPEPRVTHAFRWLPDRVEGRIWRGGPDDESPSTLLQSWTYTGPHIPRPGQTRYHINLWSIANPSSNQDVIIDDFRFLSSEDPTGACCNGGVCSVITESECDTAGGAYFGDGAPCPEECPTDGSIELRFVTPHPDFSPEDVTIADASAGIDLYVQARIVGDGEATGITTFDGKLQDDGSGTFAPVLLTFFEAFDFDNGLDDPSGRTGMFPTYRATIGPNNNDSGNGVVFFDQWAFLPLNITPSGNGEGLSGNWSDVYKFNWSSTDDTPRTVDIDLTAVFGGYQSITGLREPAPVIPDSISITIDNATCPCDLNLTGDTDVLDLLLFLSDWFPQNPAADYDNSGTVDVLDLLEFLSCWFPASSGAPCP